MRIRVSFVFLGSDFAILIMKEATVGDRFYIESRYPQFFYYLGTFLAFMFEYEYFLVVDDVLILIKIYEILFVLTILPLSIISL